MSKFFEKVATPERQRQQSKAPSGPDVDVNARARLRNKQETGIASAINDLLSITQSTASAITSSDKADYAIMQQEHDLDAKGDVRDSGSYIKTYIDSKDDGKQLEDYNPEELETITNEATQKYISDKKFGDKNYFRLIKERLDAKNGAFLDKQNVINEQHTLNKRYDVFVDEASNIAGTSIDIDETVSNLNDLVNEHVGVDGAIKDTRQNAKLRVLQRFMHDAISNRDVKALGTLKAPEMKEFFDIPDYDNAVKVLEKQTQSKVNETRQLSLDRLEEQVYLGIDNNGFSGPEQVDAWFEDQLDSMSEEQKPDTKALMKLREQALEASEEQVTYEKIYSKVKAGDSTLMERSGMKKKQRDQFTNKMFMDETGITDLSPKGLEAAINSSEKDGALKAYFNNFGVAPPVLKLYGKTPPSGGGDALKQKRNTFMNVSVLLEGTPVSLEDVYAPEELTRMTYVGRLLDDAEDGVIDEADVSQAYRNFNNDVMKNRDSFGNYISPKAVGFLADDDTKKWLTENVKDASWTTDEYSSQAYRRRQFTHYFSLAMQNTDDPAVAREAAEKMFSARHRDVEAPNGEEAVLPDDYMRYKVRDFLKVAQNHQDFKPFRAAGYFGTGLASDTYFDRSISFAPDASYEKNRVMNLYYGEGEDKKLVMSVTPQKFDEILGAVNERIIIEAKQRRRKRRTEAEELNK